MIESLDLSYSELQAMGFTGAFIQDYQGNKRDLEPQRGEDTDPNNIYSANRNGFYVDTVTPGLWFNPTPGALTGWIQLV